VLDVERDLVARVVHLLFADRARRLGLRTPALILKSML
jgi:hypothetical protein